MSRLFTDDTAPDTLTDADFAPETLTDADFAPETLTDADFAPETLTDADMVMSADEAQKAGAFHPDQLKTDWTDIAPTFGQASAGAANVFRRAASAGLTLSDKGMAAAGLGLRVAEGAAELAGMGPEGGKSAARAGLEGLRERLAEWREENLGQRNAEGKPTTEFWETIGGQAANAATEIFLMSGIGAGLGMIKGGTAAGAAAQAGKAGAAAGKAASVWQRLRPSAVTTLYGLSQAEATAGKAEDAGRGRAEQLALGALTGTWEAAMESVSQIAGAQAAMSPEVRGGVARAIRRALADTLFEGSEEALQEGGTATVEKLAGLDERTWAQIAADAARAFTVGAVTGAAIGGANTAAEAAMGRRMREQFGARLRAAETGGLGTAERRQVTEAGGLGPLARQAANIADLTQAEGRANESELSGEAAQRPDVEAAQTAQAEPGARTETGQTDGTAGNRAAGGALSFGERAARAKTVAANAPKREFRRNVSDEMLENDPVRAHVIMLGGVRPDGTEDQRGIPPVYLAGKGRGKSLDQMLTEMRGMGLELVADWTTDDLREHLRQKSNVARAKTEKKREDESEREWYKSGAVTVTPANLAIGYTFTVRGQAYEVADADADGYILVPAGADADGYALRLLSGGAMNIDKGSLRAQDGKAVKRLAEVADAATLEMFRRGERERDAAAREEMALLGLPDNEETDARDADDTVGLPTLADIGPDDDLPFAPRPGQAAVSEADDAAYMAAVEAGDRGGDNLVELLRKTEKDGRDKVVAAWLERNPETAERLEKMVVDRARAAGYKHGHLWHASAEAFNVFRRRFERDGLKSAAEAEKIQRFGKGIFFTSNESVARNFGDINRRFFLKIDDLQEANLGGFDYYEGKGYDPETGEPWLSDNGEHLRVDKSRLPDEMAEAHLDDSGTRNTGVVVRGVYESIPSAGNPKPLADTWVVGNPSQIKSADPVTRDAAGRVIPLSERFNEAEDDIRYAPRPRQAAGEGAGLDFERSAAAVPAAPKARGLTVIRRGYDAARTAADDPEYSRLARHPLDLPELVELAEDLMAGRTPRVVRQVNPAGWAAGSVRFGAETDAEGRKVYGRPTGMKLHKDNYRLVSAEEQAAWQAEAEAKYGSGEAADAAVAETLRQETAARIKAGPRLAMKVIAHEIGHIADQMTRYGIPKLDRSKSANRLNLLGRVAGAIAHTRGIISADPAGKTLSPDEARVLAGQARRNAKPDSQGRELFRAVANVWGEILRTHPEYEGAVSARELQHTLEVMRDTYPALSEWFQITTFQEQTRAVEDALRAFAEPGTQAKEARRMGGAWFRQAFVAGLEARRQAHLKQMYSELEALIAWWNGGERTMMDEYYKAPGEMFAEAFGVWLNNPGAVQKRAPMFYTTLVAYMDTRPEVQEWLREFDDMLDSGGDVRDRRIGRIRRFFSDDTRRQRRQVYDLARKKVKGRTASDMAAYIGWSKSSPLRAVLRQAERMGHKALADQGSEMADRIENLRGLEELYRAMNIEIGRVLDEGGLNVEDFDTYALLDMVARSPAYVDKANPHGLHPEAARQTLARMREQMGDAAANTLARAVETAQQIWQSEIVARLEQYGGYDPKLIKFMRENPIYFTLQVGMDDAELAEWNKALQSGDKEAVSAAAMRAIEHGLPGGQRVTGEIHTRQGTHRPPMSLLGATMLKGEALLSAAMHNEAMRQGEELLKAANDPMYAPIDENNKTARDTAMQVVLSYRVVAEDAEGTPRSKMVRYYAPRYVGHFLRGDNPASAANRVLQGTKFYLAHRTLKLWQTMAAFRFIVTQPHADRKAWNTQMPGVRTPLGNIARGHLIGGLAQMIPAATWILPPSFFPPQSRERLMRPMRDLARAYYRTGKIDPKLRKLIERGMYDLGGAWQGVGQDNPHPGEVIGTSSPMQTTPKSFATFEAESGRAVKAMQKIGQLPVIRTLMRGFHWSQDAMYAETLANKLAGMEYLDSKYPGMPERQKREWVLKAAGNPNFASRGAGDPFIDTFAWAFYNPAKEGFRSLAYSAKHDPLGFAIRTSYYNLLPNLIAKLAATGLLAEGLRRIMPHGDSPEDEEKRERFLAAFARWTSLFGRINSYYGRRHVAIPILPVGTDSALTVTVPQAQSFAPINSLINVGLDELAQAGGLDPDDDKATENIIQAISDEIPGVPFMYGQTRGMVEQTVGPILTMMLEGNTNVYDPFYQRFILDRDEEDLMGGGKWTARALPAWSKMAKNAYNSAFGSMLGRFDTKTPRADNAAKTELQKIITAPGVGALIGGWIRVTGGGESESIRELLAPETAERAAMSIKARQAAVETINSPAGTFPAWAGEMYATDPAFAKSYNRFRARAQAYSNLTPVQRLIYTKSNPKWKRQLIRDYELDRQLRARE